MNKRIDQLDPAAEVLGTHIVVIADPGTGEMFKAELDALPKPYLSTNAALTFSDVAPTNGYVDHTVTLAGAVPGDAVLLGLPHAAMNEPIAGFPERTPSFEAWVSDDDEVTVRCRNHDQVSALYLPSLVYKILVFK